MKTIREIADLCRMSKTSVNRAIKELNINTEMNGNKNYVSDEDADRIVLTLRGFVPESEQNKTEPQQNNAKSNQNETPALSVPSASQNSNEKIIEILSKQIELLEKQLENKDNQIEHLQNENALLIQAQAYSIKLIENIERTKENDTEPEENVPKEEDKPRKWYNKLFKK